MKKLLSLILASMVVSALSIINVGAKATPNDKHQDVTDYVVISESTEDALSINCNETKIDGTLYSNASVNISQNVKCNKITSDGSYILNVNNFAGSFMNYSNLVNSSEEDMYISNDKLCSAYFSEKSINASASSIETFNILGANENVNISCKNLNNNSNYESSVIFASNGNITINAENITFIGIIYAPNGNVIINSSNIKIQGIIIGKKIEISSNKCELVHNEKVLKDHNISTYDITCDDKCSDVNIMNCQGSSSGSPAYYYNTGTNVITNAYYGKYNLLSKVKKGDIIYEAAGGFGITGHIAYVEGIYYKTETYNYSSYSYSQTYTNIRVIEAISNSCGGVCRGVLDDNRIYSRCGTILRLRGGLSESKFNSITYFMRKQLGKKYALDFGSHGTSINEADWYCSELVWAAYKYAGYNIEQTGSGAGPGVTPHDIRDDNDLYKISY